MDFKEAQRAIKKGDALSIRHFLQVASNANLTNDRGWTLLMTAALEGNTAIGRELIEAGASLDQRNDFGNTALSLAAHTGHAGFFELLVQSGASLDERSSGSSFETFLDWAEQYGTGAPEAMVKIREIVRAKRQDAENKQSAGGPGLGGSAHLG